MAEKNVKKVKSFWNEEWISVETKHPTNNVDYEVSNYGRAKSVKKTDGTEQLLKGSIDKRGFRVINIRLKDGKYGCIYIHKEVANKFVEQPTDNHNLVIHLDQDKQNNHWKNLQWVTEEEWLEDLKRRETYKNIDKRKGKHVKLTETQVALLKRRLNKGKTKRKVLAKSFGITETQVRRIEKGENWGDIDALPG